MPLSWLKKKGSADLFLKKRHGREIISRRTHPSQSLAFKATGNPNDIHLRFCQAIRVNPKVKFPLYLEFLPGIEASGILTSLQIYYFSPRHIRLGQYNLCGSEGG